MAAENRLRRLAPAAATGSPGESSRSATELPRRARAPRRSACETCRTRKTGCDGGRPVCSACNRLGKTHCVYLPHERPSRETVRDLQMARQENERLRETEAFLALLASTSDEESEYLLRRFRTDGDITALLATATGGIRSGQSPMRTGTSDKQGALPPSRKHSPALQSSLEFELMARHPIAYPTLIPIDAAYLDIDRLLNPDDLSWADEELASLADTSLADDIFDASSMLSDEEQVIHDRLSRRPSQTPSGTNTPPMTGTSLPLCDERLSCIDVGRWTSVSVTNEFVARVLSLYLTTDHPVLGLFDADLFLDNAVSGEENFCSKLLFSSLLASACQSYNHLESEATPLSHLFYREASRHWQDTVQSGHFTLTAVAASQLLSITALCSGRDAESIAFLKSGTQIGTKLGLFGVTEGGSAKSWLDHHYNWVRAASHTAWGVFGWVTIRCLAFHAGQIESPPTLPIPGDGRRSAGIEPSDSFAPTTRSSNIPNQDQEFHGLPDYMGNTFPALCKLWVISNDFIWHHYDHDDTVAPVKRARLERAHNTYRELLEWADSLPIDMARGDDNKHHTIIAHVFYHAIILDVFRPFMLMRGPERDTRLDPFTATDATPTAIYAASTKQLLRLALTYRARFQPIISFLWQTALLYVANVMLSLTVTNPNPTAAGASASQAEAAGRLRNRRWLRLCLKGYKTLYRSFPAVEKTVLGLLSMAMRNRIMSASEARTVMSDLRESVSRRPPTAGHGGGDVEDGEEEEEERDELGTRVGAGEESAVWPTAMIDLDLAMSNPLASDVQTLAAQFHELALFEEFTTAVPEEESEGDESGEKMIMDC